MKPFVRKSFVHAVLALGLVGAPALAGATLLGASSVRAEAAPTLEEMKQTLAAYGAFVTSPKYGEVWKPTVTPQGWHPYPACDWVYTKDYGWYFDDKTPWGAIVHHYGRWTHDATEGWLWVPGVEFSPGWVVWRTSAEWVGWAPTMPDVDMTAANVAAFDDDKLWTFMDVKKFGSTCDGVAAASQTPVLFDRTTYVTEMRFTGGVGVFVLPTWIVGPVVNINIGIFAPWSTSFIGSWVWNWTSIFNDVDINIVVVKDCGPGKTPNDQDRPRTTPISTPPAPPPNLRQPPRRTENVRPDRPQRVAQPRRPRTVDTFEPQPDDVIEQRQPRRPQYQPRRPRPDVVFEEGGRQRGPRAERAPRGFDPGFSPRRAMREFDPGRGRRIAEGQDRMPSMERMRAPRGDFKASRSDRGEARRNRTFEADIR